MVIYDFYVLDAVICPNKTDAVFVIDPDGVLAPAVTPEWLQPVARRNPEIIQLSCHVELLEFSQSYLLNVGGQVGRFVTSMDFFGGFTSKREDHLRDRYAQR
jgi:hypothetical protein